MTDITRRDFIRLATAVGVSLAAPIVVAQEVLELDIHIDEDKLNSAISVGGHGKTQDGQTCIEAHIDTEKMWQAVHATDQRGRRWTTPDGHTWTSGADSFTV